MVLAWLSNLFNHGCERLDEALASMLSSVALSRDAAAIAYLELRVRARAALAEWRLQTRGAYAAAEEIAEIAKVRAQILKDRATDTASDLRAAAEDAASQPSVKATAVGSAGGAAALGAGGAVTGLTTGMVLGAISGLPLALFTFGLSIPVGAVLGGGTGAVVGTAAGATTGAVGGGAVGYGAFAKREAIARVAGSAMAKASDGADLVKGTAAASLSYVKAAASAARARMRRSGTGGSEDAD